MYIEQALDSPGLLITWPAVITAHDLGVNPGFLTDQMQVSFFFCIMNFNFYYCLHLVLSILLSCILCIYCILMSCRCKFSDVLWKCVLPPDPVLVRWWMREVSRPESKANSECIPRARKVAGIPGPPSDTTEADNPGRDKGELWVIEVWHLACNPGRGWPEPGSLLRTRAQVGEAVELGQTAHFGKSPEMAGIFLSRARCSKKLFARNSGSRDIHCLLCSK